MPFRFRHRSEQYRAFAWRASNVVPHVQVTSTEHHHPEPIRIVEIEEGARRNWRVIYTKIGKI